MRELRLLIALPRNEPARVLTYGLPSLSRTTPGGSFVPSGSVFDPLGPAVALMLSVFSLLCILPLYQLKLECWTSVERNERRNIAAILIITSNFKKICTRKKDMCNNGRKKETRLIMLALYQPMLKAIKKSPRSARISSGCAKRRSFTGQTRH